jgi:excisionase family DNA binding protein
MSDQLYTIKEVQAMLKVSQATIYRMVYDGRLSHIKIGKLVRIPAEAIRELIEKGVESTNTPKRL